MPNVNIDYESRVAGRKPPELPKLPDARVVQRSIQRVFVVLLIFNVLVLTLVFNEIRVISFVAVYLCPTGNGLIAISALCFTSLVYKRSNRSARSHKYPVACLLLPLFAVFCDWFIIAGFYR